MKGSNAEARVMRHLRNVIPQYDRSLLVSRLKEYREKLEVEMEHESGTDFVTRILTDVCDILHLTTNDKAEVLGHLGDYNRDACGRQRNRS